MLGGPVGNCSDDTASKTPCSCDPDQPEGFYYDPPPKATQEEKLWCWRQASEEFDRHWKRYEESFAEALAQRDVDKAHQIWCSAAELWLALNQAVDCELKAVASLKLARRGSEVPLITQPLAQNVRVTKDAKFMGFDATKRRTLSRLLEIKCVLQMAAQRGEEMDTYWQTCLLNDQQVTNLRNLITNLKEDGAVDLQDCEGAFTGVQFLHWCDAAIVQ